jgi:DNA-binding CsgD family transcriptional regulator
MSESQRRELSGIRRSRESPVRTIRQASALLLAAAGVSNEEVARRVGAAPRTVSVWRANFDRAGVSAVRRYDGGLTVPDVIPRHLLHQMSRRAEPPGAIVGVYFHPDQHVLALCDERTRPRQHDPTPSACREGHTDGWSRVLCALAQGGRHIVTDRRALGHEDLLRFLKHVGLAVPDDRRVDLVVDGLSAHITHFDVDRWLAHPKRRRFRLHLAPSREQWTLLAGRWLRCPREPGHPERPAAIRLDDLVGQFVVGTGHS